MRVALVAVLRAVAVAVAIVVVMVMVMILVMVMVIMTMRRVMVMTVIVTLIRPGFLGRMRMSVFMFHPRDRPSVARMS